MNEKTLREIKFSNDDPLLKIKVDSFLQHIFYHEAVKGRDFNQRLLKFILEESTYLPDFQFLNRVYNDVKMYYLSSDLSGGHSGSDLGKTILHHGSHPKEYPTITLEYIFILMRKWIQEEREQGNDVQKEESYLVNLYNTDIIARNALRLEYVTEYPELVLPEVISFFYLSSGDKKYWQKIALDIPPKILIPPLLNMFTSEDNSFNESFIKSRKELIFWTLSSINVKGLISKDFLVDEYLKNKFSVGFLPNLVRHLADSDYELSRKLIDDFRDKEQVKTIAGSFGYELGRLFSKNDEFIFELIFDTKLSAEFRTGVIDSYSPIEPEKAIVQFIDLIKDPDEQIAIASQTKMVYLKDLVKGIIKISADISEEELLADLHKGLPITKHQRKSLVSFLSIQLEQKLRSRLNISDTNVDLRTLLNKAKKEKIYEEDTIRQLHRFRKARNDTLHKDEFCPTSIILETYKITKKFQDT